MSLSLHKAYKISLLSTLVMLTTSGLSSSAYAAAFEIKQQSVSGAGSAHAGVAVGTDISSMYWNPAATANVKGTNVEQHGFGILIDSDMRSTGTPLSQQIGDRFDGVIEGAIEDLLPAPFGSYLGYGAAHVIDVNLPGDIRNSTGDWVMDQALASVYFNHQINDKMFVGFSLNSPLGPSSTPKHKVWEGALQAKNTDIFTMEGTGTVAYKFSDMLTVGGGFRVQYMKNGNELAMPTLTDNPLSLPGPNCGGLFTLFKDCIGVNMDLSSTAGVESDSFGYGYSLGATIQPFKGTSIGFGYKSEIKHKLKGRMTAPLLVDNLALSMDAEWEMYSPAMATASIRQRITDQTTLLGTVQWMNWSVYKSIDIKLKPNDFVGDLATGIIGDTISEKLNWDDSWFYSVGLEHKFNKKFTGRAGVAYEVSPMQKPEQRTVRIPDADRIYLSAGGTYNYSDKLSFDFAYTYMTAEDDYKISRTDPIWGTELEAVGNLQYHEFGVSMKYKF